MTSEIHIGHTLRAGKPLVVVYIDDDQRPLALSPDQAVEIATQLILAAQAARERTGEKREAA